ncbi:MAG: peptidoglycan DD-metalloendopeptidase family protein [Patescibacteria group bacterium]
MKINRKIIAIFILTFFALGNSATFAETTEQKVAQLKEQIEQLQKQQEEYRNTIAQTEEQARTLKSQIKNIQTQISSLQNQIQLTGKQIDKTALEIGQTQENITETQTKIDYQKSTVGELLLYLSKRDNESLVGVLMKNANLSDYFNNAQYALTVNSKLLDLIGTLKEEEEQLNDHKGDLESKKNELQTLKASQSAQKSALGGVQSEKNNLLVATKGQEAQYQKLLAQAEQQEAAFFSQLQELEDKVIKGGLYIVHITATTPLPKKGTKLFQLPETGARTTQGYGCTSYARCGSKKGAYHGSPHNGIDFASGIGTPIHAIGDGEIIANGVNNPGWGNWVAVRHPNQNNLVSIYAHMSSLAFLQVGTQIKVGEILGFEGKTGKATGPHLHLSLYKDFFTYTDSKGVLYFNYFEGSINPSDYL